MCLETLTKWYKVQVQNDSKMLSRVGIKPIIFSIVGRGVLFFFLFQNLPHYKYVSCVAKDYTNIHERIPRFICVIYKLLFFIGFEPTALDAVESDVAIA